MTSISVTLVAGVDPSRPRPGGIRAYVLGLARHLPPLGAHVTLVGIGEPWDGEPFRFLPALRGPGDSRAFQRAIRRLPADGGLFDGVVHAQRPDDLGALRAPDAAAACVTVHGDPLPGIRERHGPLVALAYRWLERKGVRAARRLLFVDPDGMDAFVRRHPRDSGKFRESSVGVDLAVFRPTDRDAARSRWGFDGRPHVLFAGRLEAEKNLGLLVAALRRSQIRPVLVVAGSGPLESAVRADLSSLPHRFLGAVAHEAMPDLYSSVDATLLPSTREAMPTVALESLACGTPVVATPVGRLPDLVETGATGAIAPPDPDRFARAVDATVARSSEMRDACRSAAAPFGWEKVARSVLREYEAVAP